MAAIDQPRLCASLNPVNLRPIKKPKLFVRLSR